MESLESQQSEPRHGAAHLCSRRRARNFTSSGAIQVKEKNLAASGRWHGRRGRRRGIKTKCFIISLVGPFKGFPRCSTKVCPRNTSVNSRRPSTGKRLQA